MPHPFTHFASILIFFILSSPVLKAQRYEKLHHTAILVNTHNDVLIATMQGLDIATDLTGKTHSDLARFEKRFSL